MSHMHTSGVDRTQGPGSRTKIDLVPFPVHPCGYYPPPPTHTMGYGGKVRFFASMLEYFSTHPTTQRSSNLSRPPHFIYCNTYGFSIKKWCFILTPSDQIPLSHLLLESGHYPFRPEPSPSYSTLRITPGHLPISAAICGGC